MKTGKGKIGKKALAWLGLIVFFPSFLSCTSVRSQKLETPAQLPPSQENTQVRTTAPYILEVSDELSITVWGHDDLKRTVNIDNTGEITLPLLGQIKLAGQTVPKARELITAKLKKYIVDPQVEISTNFGRWQVYVFGEVTSPGIITYRRPLMVLEAIAKAGWFSRDANRKTVLLVRRANDKFNVFAVNVGELFVDGSKVPEVYMQSGDLLYVSAMPIVKLERFLQHVNLLAQPFLTVEQAVVLWPQFIDALQGKTVTAPGLAIGTSPSSTTK